MLKGGAGRTPVSASPAPPQPGGEGPRRDTLSAPTPIPLDLAATHPARRRGGAAPPTPADRGLPAPASLQNAAGVPPAVRVESLLLQCTPLRQPGWGPEGTWHIPPPPRLWVAGEWGAMASSLRQGWGRQRLEEGAPEEGDKLYQAKPCQQQEEERNRLPPPLQKWGARVTRVRKTWPALEESGWGSPHQSNGGQRTSSVLSTIRIKERIPSVSPPPKGYGIFFWDCHIFFFFFWTGRAQGRSFSFCGE